MNKNRDNTIPATNEPIVTDVAEENEADIVSLLSLLSFWLWLLVLPLPLLLDLVVRSVFDTPSFVNAALVTVDDPGLKE